MIFIGAGSLGLMPLPARFRFASTSRNFRSFANVFAVGCRLPDSKSRACDAGNPDSLCKFAKRFVATGEIFPEFSHCCDWIDRFRDYDLLSSS